MCHVSRRNPGELPYILPAPQFLLCTLSHFTEEIEAEIQQYTTKYIIQDHIFCFKFKTHCTALRSLLALIFLSLVAPNTILFLFSHCV